MNKLSVKITLICLCAAIMLGGAGAAYALTGEKNEVPAKVVTTSTKAEEEKEVSKDETVYVLAGADGSVQKIIVSDWIKNALNENSIADKSGLSDIENVKGNETYTLDGSNMTVWDAEGNDIYYQGNVEKELPVAMFVSYKLDGKPISADELAGKSGKVTIRFDYENRQYETVNIDGKNEKIYVPFGMLTGMLLDSDTFRNVEVSHGKLLNDGDRTAVIGIAFPGLQENLGIDKDKVEIPDYVEITADVTDFELGMTLTIATNEIFNELDAAKIDSADGLISSLNELTDGMQQLMDGSSALYDGLCTLLDKSGELVDGIEKLANGAKTLKDGADSLDEGAAQLQKGAADLSSGLNTLASNNASLNGGAKQVFDTLLSTATAQINAAGISVPALTVDNYADVLNTVQSQISAASEGAKSIISLKESLDSYNSFYLGLLTYTDGVASAANGAATLSSGTSDLKGGTAQLKEGTSSLYDGILQLKNGTPALVDGVTQLKDGAMQLSDGLKQFNEEGIQKLVDLVGGDIESMLARVRATIDVSKDYQNFSGISVNMDGQVKFIYRTDEIK